MCSPTANGLCWPDADNRRINYLHIYDYMGPQWVPGQPRITRAKINNLDVELKK